MTLYLRHCGLDKLNPVAYLNRNHEEKNGQKKDR